MFFTTDVTAIGFGSSGVLMVGFGLIRNIERKRAMHNFLVKKCHNGLELKSFLIDPNINYCKVMKICGFVEETDHPVYFGNKRVKIPMVEAQQ